MEKKLEAVASEPAKQAVLNDGLGDAYSRGWADGERDGRLNQLRIQLAIATERDKYRLALEEIANIDYRGNRSQEQEVAYRALGDA